MHRFLGVTVFSLLSCFALGQSLTSREWERIGQEKVGYRPESDSMSVSKSKVYRAIKLHVLENDVVIEKWALEYRDGTIQHVGFMGLAPAGKEYPPVQIHGPLKKIHFRYQTVDKKKKAKVEILGLK